MTNCQLRSIAIKSIICAISAELISILVGYIAEAFGRGGEAGGPLLVFQLPHISGMYLAYVLGLDNFVISILFAIMLQLIFWFSLWYAVDRLAAKTNRS